MVPKDAVANSRMAVRARRRFSRWAGFWVGFFEEKGDSEPMRVLLVTLLGAFGFDERMARLLLAISYENISTGIAGASFVAYLSGIVSKRFTAVQYALLSSLTFLIGSLGRGFAGEAVDLYGYATVFRWTAAAGCLAVVFVLLEWVRSSREARRVAA